MSDEERQKYLKILLTLVILLIVGLQTVGSLGLTGNYLYPFFDYPMYQKAHQKGEPIHRYRLRAITKEGKEIEVTPDTLNINFFKYFQNPVYAMRVEDKKLIETYIEKHRKRNGIETVEWRLYDLPIIPTENGPQFPDPLLLKTYKNGRFK